MGSKQVGFLLTVVMLVLVLDCGNCNVQQFEVAKSIRLEDYVSVLHRDSRSDHRSRRSVLNMAEMQEALDCHNRLRRLEGASNMELMIWDAGLANTASTSAESCIWRHTNTGQNLYSTSDVRPINLTAAIEKWYDEKPFYADYIRTNTCNAPEQQCLHYSQVVWSTSRKLGCAYTRCPAMQFSDLKSALLLVCNYDPPGNVVGELPYQTGTGCSKCATGSWWCNNGLCDRGCTAIGKTCGCAPVCLNFASINADTCNCSCTPGWQGSDCNDVCQDKDPQCDPKPGQYGYPPSFCSGNNGPAIQKLCPRMCGKCKAVGSSTSMKPSLLNMLSVWLSWLLIYSLRSI